MENSRIDALQAQLQETLLKAVRRVRFLHIFRILCYGGSFIYFIGMFVVANVLPHFKSDLYQHLGNNTLLTYIIPLFVLITLGSIGSSYYYSKYIRTEQETIKRIVEEMFPTAEYTLTNESYSLSRLMLSGLFGTIDREKVAARTVATLKVNKGNSTMTLNDISVSKLSNWSSKLGGDALFIPMYLMVKGAFGKRMDDITNTFRGLFSTTTLKKRIDGTVIIMPDQLEKHIDYLAENIQKLKSRAGLKFVKMENSEFEKNFSVYSTDDILARYILTPTLMQRIVELKKEYKRDIMLSYSANQFYAAVSMPEGFLGLDSAKLSKGDSIYNFYHNVNLAQDIMLNLNTQ